jgi:glycyl-tRNA synthetase
VERDGRARDDIEGLDAAILMHPRVWEASGHVAASSIRWSTASNCKKRFRADDQKIKGVPGTKPSKCPGRGMSATLTSRASST